MEGGAPAATAARVAAREQEGHRPALAPRLVVQRATAEPRHHQVRDDEPDPLPLLAQHIEGIRLVVSDLVMPRSEEHTSELQSRSDLVCRLLLEKKRFA